MGLGGGLGRLRGFRWANGRPKGFITDPNDLLVPMGVEVALGDGTDGEDDAGESFVLGGEAEDFGFEGSGHGRGSQR